MKKKTCMISFACYRAPIGRVFILAIDGKIAEVSIGDEKGFLRRTKARYGALPQEDKAFFNKAFKTLDEYFKGRPVEFDLPLALSGSPFQKKVWEAIRSIPWGSVKSYGWIAGQIGKPHGARAVGNACGANPAPVIVPCHRVVKGDGGLGGYTGGVGIKKALLAVEGNSSLKATRQTSTPRTQPR
ncbi:MAG: methylated-DNA--[protein]-cysteine S-methyltransferase [Deltaproteobacteria bacterium]|nr:methylated-DNA--[protein]-cysteine S-methyltransferase [Deltaproteobacteria bacterium]